MRYYLGLFLIFACSFSVFVQEDVEASQDVTVNSQFWTDFNGKYQFDEKNGVSGFLAYRSLLRVTYSFLGLFPNTSSFDIRNSEKKDYLRDPEKNRSCK